MVRKQFTFPDKKVHYKTFYIAAFGYKTATQYYIYIKFTAFKNSPYNTYVLFPTVGLMIHDTVFSLHV